MLTLDPNRLGRLEGWAEHQVATRRFAGLSLLIRQHGREVFYTQCGVRDLESGAAFARDTVARIYSMTKPITSLILMMLVEEGRVHLDAPLSRFLPEFAAPRALRPRASTIHDTEPCAVPTLHHLLTHRSGLSYAFNPGIVPAAMAEKEIFFNPLSDDLQAQCAQLADLPLAFAPGARWEYAVGIDVIGRVIEVIEDRPLSQVFAHRVLGPLGMSETAFTVRPDQRDRFATLYTAVPGNAMNLAATPEPGTLRVYDAPETSPFLATTCYSGGGGLVGTIDDYMAFAEALRLNGGGLVSTSTAAFMMANHLPGDIASLGPKSFAEQPMEGVGFGIGGAVVIDPARSRVPSSMGDFSWGGMASTFLDRKSVV